VKPYTPERRRGRKPERTITVRMSGELHAALTEYAYLQRMPVNELACDLFRAACLKYHKSAKMLRGTE